MTPLVVRPMTATRRDRRDARRRNHAHRIAPRPRWREAVELAAFLAVLLVVVVALPLLWPAP